MTSQVAQAFYDLYRSANCIEIRDAIKRLSEISTLDKKDLAFLVVILEKLDCRTRADVFRSSVCRNSVKAILQTVAEKDENDEKFLQDCLHREVNESR